MSSGASPTLEDEIGLAQQALAAIARRLEDSKACPATERGLLLNAIAQHAAAGVGQAARAAADEVGATSRAISTLVGALDLSLQQAPGPRPQQAPGPSPQQAPGPSPQQAPGPRPPIGIRGKKGAGKDTLAAEICACFPEYGIRKWAAKLREAAALLTDIPAENTVSDADKEVQLGEREYASDDLLARILMAATHVLGDRDVPADLPGRAFTILTGQVPTVATATIPMTVGRLLQLLGTECFRDLVGPDVWVEALLLPWDAAGRPPVVVADTRFPNESAALRNAGGVVVLVRRAAAARADGRADEHASECALDGEPADFVFDNEGSVGDLRAAFLAAWPALLALAASRQ